MLLADLLRGPRSALLQWLSSNRGTLLPRSTPCNDGTGVVACGNSSSSSSAIRPWLLATCAHARLISTCLRSIAYGDHSAIRKTLLQEPQAQAPAAPGMAAVPEIRFAR